MARQSTVDNGLEYVDITILNGEATSDTVPLLGKALVGIVTPSNLRSVASVTVKAVVAGTAKLVNVGGTDESVTLAVSTLHKLDPAAYLGASDIQLVGNGNASANLVMQLALRNF